MTKKGAIQKSTVQNLQKLASVRKLKQLLLENYSEIRKYHVISVRYENNHLLIMQMQLLCTHFPENPWVSYFMVYTYHTTMFFQSSVCLKQQGSRINVETVVI